MNWKSFLGLAPNSSATEGEQHLTSRSGEFLSALVFLGVAASFLAVLGKCGWMQLVEGEQWTFTQQQTQSQTRHSTITRGKILDKNGFKDSRNDITANMISAEEPLNLRAREP